MELDWEQFMFEKKEVLKQRKNKIAFQISQPLGKDNSHYFFLARPVIFRVEF